jgi:hypothetical protein
MESLNRTDQCTIRIATIYAGFSDNVGHLSVWPPEEHKKIDVLNKTILTTNPRVLKDEFTAISIMK